jgi:hypothetical protein
MPSTAASLCGLVLACIGSYSGAAGGDAGLPRTSLIGAWHLVSIQLTTRDGTIPDPFFEAGSVGLIVYDPSGWMSVQISGPRRAAWDIPATRPPTSKERDLRLKAAAFDSYYAYYGTWDYDEPRAVMTHHVKASVIPAEVGLDYSQQIRIDGNRMTFIGHVREHGEDITRTKVWER